MLRLVLWSILLAFTLILLRDPTSAEEPVRPQRKVALIVGVTGYLHDFEALSPARRIIFGKTPSRRLT